MIYEGAYLWQNNDTTNKNENVNGKELFLLEDSINSKHRVNDSIIDPWKGQGVSVILKLIILNETGDEKIVRGLSKLKQKKYAYENN